MLKVLFVCSRNRLRSPTAEQVFSKWPGVEVASAGTAKDADEPVTAELVEWADLILSMEAVHRTRLKKMFGPLLKDTKMVVLGVPDDYEYMDPELVELLKKVVTPHLGHQT